MLALRQRGIHLRSRTARFENFDLAAAFAVSVGVCAALAFGYYWLLKPTVFENRGLAAYKPPPKTIVSSVPWVPPDPSSEVYTAYARVQPAPEPESKTVVAPKDEKKAREAPRASNRERAARVRPAPTWNNYAPGRSYGWRPWF
jgi:hypothetical protein